MKKSIYVSALAALALTGCTLNEASKLNPEVERVDKPAPVITYEGSGNLVTGEIGSEVQLASTYSWEAKDNAVVININFDLKEYIESGNWELGYFFLDVDSMNDFFGMLVTSDTNEDNFYGVDPDGTPCEWTSYKPGMWVTKDGVHSNSSGTMYWQWYIWTGREGIYYDYGEGTDKAYNGLFLIGGNPGNVAGSVAELAGTTTTSKAKLISGTGEFDFIVNVKYSDYVAEKKVEASGNLSYHSWTSDEDYEIVETSSTYDMLIHENEGIQINLDINTQEWSESGEWEIGFMKDFSFEAFEEVYGIDPTTLDAASFYPVNPDGSACEWTSYKPGMWIDNTGTAADWSSGIAYWQWYLYADQGYDYPFEGNEGLFMVGGNPGNVSTIEFETPIVSHAVIEAGGKTIPVSITYVFHEVILPETEGYPEAVFQDTGTPYPYGGGVYGNHTIQWYFDDEGLTVDVDAHVPTIVENGDWVFTAVTIPTDVMTGYLGIDDIEQLFDLNYFYPLNPDGTPAGEWTTYAPGEWVDATGTACGWADGAMYWWYQWGEHKYEGHFTEGLFLVGTNPGNVPNVVGQTVTSLAQLGDKLLKVNVHYYDGYPTAKEGKVGPYSYSWSMSDSGLDIESSVSLSTMDESWAWMGFFINEAYINDKFQVDIAQLATSLDTFYPVDADGNKLEKWTSYVPGMWFLEDGGAGAWDTGVSFWQYYTSNYAELGSHDFEAPNLLYVGKNPGYEFTPGTYVSKAKFSDYDFSFTIHIAE